MDLSSLLNNNNRGDLYRAGTIASNSSKAKAEFAGILYFLNNEQAKRLPLEHDNI